MKLGPILGALGGGALASVLGGGSQLGALSPLLFMLLQKKKKKDGEADDGSPPVDPSKYNLTQSPMLRAMPGNPIMAMPPGSQQAPFGMGRPPGMY